MKKILCLLMAVCMLTALAACGAQNSSEQEAAETDVPKSEQEGTAGSNIPLKDNEEEAKKQVEIALQKLIDETYGDKVDELKVVDVKIYTAEDEQANEVLKDYNLTENEVAFEVNYELHAAEGADPIELTAATGEYDEATGWVTNKFNLGVLRPADDGTYQITDFGTGW